MDAIKLLKADHRTVEELFKRYEGLGPRAFKGRRDVVDRIIRELAVHSAVEETTFYPAVRAAVSDSKAQGNGKAGELVLESLEEHHIVKWTLSELEKMDSNHERFHPKVMVMMEAVRHHVEEEENELFPKVAKLMKPERLRELGEVMEAAKKTAPTRPHPRMPDEPPFNILGAPGAALMDKARDAGRRLVRTATGG
jgi:hemerythrin superfamily protein